MNRARAMQRIIGRAHHQVALTLLITLMCPVRGTTDETEGEPVPKYTNALIDSTSPYLLQHAHNPVNWMPWGPEAFNKARSENKPIFVSIGYSTCYWCHVMERESFEDEGVAQILNEHYVAIKVDREQRPDIDEQLMLATQLLTGRGGWPNSVWLTTDGRPWMAGTYFPRQQFKEALRKLSEVWNEQAEAVNRQAESLTEAIRQASTLEVPTDLADVESTPRMRLLAELRQIFDESHGGFGTRPKFPPHGILRLLTRAAAEGNQDAHRMLTRTLNAMWCGGIHDHVGGGFHRYSTDERWLLPHFEKMLYDNAQLMRSYTEAFLLERDPIYHAAVQDIFRWLQAEMTHARGGFFSAIDSESEGGEEGRYYTWSVAELEKVLEPQEAARFREVYNFGAEGNFTEESTGQRPGTNIPYLRRADIALSLDDDLISYRTQLNAARKSREYPHLDDKILTAWNGLMISALARAGVVFEDESYVRAAREAADFVLQELQENGQLLRTWRENQASLPGYLNDYAFFAEALVELHAATEDPRWLTEARRITDDLLRLFEDGERGGFFFTGEHHESLLVRSKHIQGGGNLPNGNGIAVQVLLRLHAETGERRYRLAAERALQSFAKLIRQSPRQVEHLVLADEMFGQLRAGAEPSAATGTEPALASASPSVFHDANGIVSVKLISEYRQVIAGQSLQVAVDFEIADKHHLYGPTGDDSVIQAVSVEVEGSPSLIVGNPIFPEGRLVFDRVLDQKLRIYEDHLRCLIPIKVRNADSAGAVKVVVKVQYQACNERECLATQSAELEIEIPVGSEQLPSPEWPAVLGDQPR